MDLDAILAYRSRFSNDEPMQAEDALTDARHQSAIEGSGESPFIVIELLHADAVPPRRATQGSAGYDLFAYLTGRIVDCSDGHRRWTEAAHAAESPARIILPAHAMALIPLGFKARLPNGYEAQIRPRSGAAFKKGLGIPNAPGTVDSDFPEEWRVIVRNTTDAPIELAHGERIAQMVLHRYEVLRFTEGTVGVTTERLGGFGSTGG
jgi:dUTP diphosphatase